MQGETELKLTYRFEPGAAHDGVTVHVPLKILPQLRSEGFEWLVPGAARRARHRADPLAAEGAAQAARARPGRRGEGAREPRAAPAAAAGGARGRDRGPARRADRRPPTGTSRRLPALPEDDLQRRGRAGQGDRLRPGPERAARAGAAEAARRARAGATRKLERTGQTTWTFGKIPKVVALPGHRPVGPRLPVAGRRGRHGRAARAGEPRGAAAEHARGHAPAADADDPLPRCAPTRPSSATRPRWRCWRRRTRRSARCSRTPRRPRSPR